MENKIFFKASDRRWTVTSDGEERRQEWCDERKETTERLQIVDLSVENKILFLKKKTKKVNS